MRAFQQQIYRFPYSSKQHTSLLLGHGGTSYTGRQVCRAFRVQPYKLRSGESVDDVAAEKGERSLAKTLSHVGMETHELLLLNHELEAEDYKEGQSILVPQARVSEEDRLILKHMKERRYRTYAVHARESIEDIMEARQIEWSEVEALNPGTDLGNLKAREIIKLPAHKYSAHEQHEMQGSLGSPQAFHLGSLLMNTLVAVGMAICLYCFWLYRQSKQAKAAAEIEKKIAASRKKYEVPNGLPMPSYMASVDEGESYETAPEG